MDTVIVSSAGAVNALLSQHSSKTVALPLFAEHVLFSNYDMHKTTEESARIPDNDEEEVESGWGVNTFVKSCPSAVLGIVGVIHRTEPCSLSFFSIEGTVVEQFDPATATTGKASAFGDLYTGETKVDASVRRATEFVSTPTTMVQARINCKLIKNADELRKTDDSVLKQLHCKVCQQLFPHLGEDFVEGGSILRLHKVTVYKAGDHFTRHVDTPRPNVLATVVLLSNSDAHKFTGGTLRVYHPRADEVLALSCKDESELQFAAFLPGLVHEIEPVVSGVRVAAVFDLVANTPADPVSWLRTAGEWTFTDVQFTQSLREDKALLYVEHTASLLRKIDLSHIRHLGVVASHRYSFDEVQLGALKGVDSQVPALLETFGFGFAATLVPVAIYVNDTDDPVSEYTNRAVRVYRMTREDLVHAIALTADGPMPTEVADASKTLVVIPSCMQETGFIFMIEEDAIEHTGNESRPFVADCRYFKCVIVAKRGDSA